MEFTLKSISLSWKGDGPNIEHVKLGNKDIG